MPTANLNNALYGILTLLFLCITGPLIRSFPHVGAYWMVILFSSVVGVILYQSMKLTSQAHRLAKPTLDEFLLFVYLILLSWIALVHACALFLVPSKTIINAAGLRASQALKNEVAYSVLYLFFPLMLFAQKILFRSIPTSNLMRWFGLAAFATSCAVILQTQAYPDFFHASWWGRRYEGLGTDPNALAMSIFLMLPMIVTGIVLEKKWGNKILYCVVFGSAIFAMWNTGSRASTAGAMLFILLLPLAMAIAFPDWTKKARISVALAPFLASLFAAPLIISVIGNFGVFGARLEETWEKFVSGGFAALFTEGEPRGLYFPLGLSLIRKSMDSGWGPAGFYRESENIHYATYGYVNPYLFDSVLNHYLMIAVDFGLPVLALNIMILLLPIGLGIRLIGNLKAVEHRFVVAMFVISEAIFLMLINVVPPSYFLDVVWIWTAHLAMLLVIAQRQGIAWSLPQGRIRTGIMAASLFIMLMVALGSYQTAFGKKYGYAARTYSPWWVSEGRGQKP